MIVGARPTGGESLVKNPLLRSTFNVALDPLHARNRQTYACNTQAPDQAFDTKDKLVTLNEMDLLIVVKNLVDNAIRYTPHGGRIDLCVELTQETAILQVKDSGPGITAEEQSRVFDPFYRCLGTDEAGSGLGLSIVKAIADRTGACVRLSCSDEMTKSGLCVSVALKQASANPPAKG
ncbi:hypothetical protein AEQ67_09450 [Pseudomonas sp. RIT-PI-q]|nr:hypothetical protein AEQ67_09450 [Pseudomonas sp. RIT-PI-q]